MRILSAIFSVWHNLARGISCRRVQFIKKDLHEGTDGSRICL